MEDAQVPQKAQDKLSSLSQNKFDSIVLKLSTDVGLPNLFKMDIPTTGLPIICKLCPIPLKYQKFIDEEIWHIYKLQVAFQKAEVHGQFK